MNLEDRISRIENALISAGLIEPEPIPGIREAMTGGDKAAMRRCAASILRRGNVQETLEQAGLIKPRRR